MTLAVVSPHLDDAIFSLCETLASHPDAVIICPFGGIPPDEAGKAKYELLSAEHDLVCTKMDLGYVSGTFLDDVYYANRDVQGLALWLYDTLQSVEATDVWIPLGIHHPDHRLVAKAALQVVEMVELGLGIYEELPYRVLYPEHTNREILRAATLCGYTPRLELKQNLCRMYASQINEDIERCLYVPERLWRLR